MCLVGLKKYLKHIQIACQYLKIGQFHSKSGFPAPLGNLGGLMTSLALTTAWKDQEGITLHPSYKIC